MTPFQGGRGVRIRSRGESRAVHGVIDKVCSDPGKLLLSRLTRHSIHLLKLQHQPERASASWRGTIVEQSTRIRRMLKGSPSLRPEMPAFIAEAYVDARPQAAAETEIANFPAAPTPEFERALQAASAGEDFGLSRLQAGTFQRGESASCVW